jgi:carbon monoxide dehydrogenase subunit G
MATATRTINIARQPDAVFAVLSDPTREQAWRKHVRSFQPAGPLAVGTLVRQTVDGPGGRPIRADLRLTAFDPGERYAFEVVAGPVRPVGEYRLTAADGGTDLTFTLSAELRGIRAALLGKAVQRSMDGEMRSLDRLKALIEAG